MANSCSNTLKIENLPKVIKKVEYFLFRAMEKNNVNNFEIAQNPGNYLATLMSTAKNLIDDQVKEYIDKAATAKEKGEMEVFDEYNSFAFNLQNISSNWANVVVNTLVYSKIFGIKTKFKLDDNGMVDLEDVIKKLSPDKYEQAINELLKSREQSGEKDSIKFKFDDLGLTDLSQLADDEDSIYKKFIVDQAANEIDPFDTIDKAVEIFIRSIPQDNYVSDEYGFNVNIDYASFVRNLMADLEGTITINEMVSKLKNNLDKTPEYQRIIDMLEFKPSDNSIDIQLKINFRNSFTKAQIPIYNTSIEDNVVKVFEATVARRSKYEQKIKSNFALAGMPVMVGGKEVNLAHDEDGVWTLDKSDTEKILKYLDAKYEEGKVVFGKGLSAEEKTSRRINFLKSVGFEFSPKTEEVLRKTIATKKSFEYILTHLLNRLNVPNTKGKLDVTNDPLTSIKNDWYTKGKKSAGQNNIINDIIEIEIKYNPSYNIERSVINPEGNRQHSTQLHNNFTIVNKYLSDYEAFPNEPGNPPLQRIIAEAPSLAWLSPETNPGIRNDMYLNSLFFLDPASPDYGMRKKVYSDVNGKYKYSSTQGVYVALAINNTGGVQLKDDGNFKVDGSSSTGLNEGDKLLQDLNTFMKAGFSSTVRLSDKSTDIGISSNFYSDPVTGEPYKRPLGSLDREQYSNVFTSAPFVAGIVNALKDIMGMKYLGQKGFYNNLDFASKNILSSWGILDQVLSKETKDDLNEFLKSDALISVEQAQELINDPEILANVYNDVREYFKGYSEEYLKKLEPVKNLVDTEYLVGKGNFKDIVNYYLANTFLIDLSNMKIFFGDSIHFKAFTKRASKDSATGIFTFVEPELLTVLNDRLNAQGYGVNTNLSARLLAERLFLQGKITQDQRDAMISKQDISKEFKSAVLLDVEFKSKQGGKVGGEIDKNIQKLYEEGHISEKNYELYKNNIKKVIEDKYSGQEGDGQGKVTFDFYRVMSILTNSWGQQQEESYKRIVEYAHYDELAEGEMDETKKAEYIAKRDAVGYSPIEQIYFPPKKFQYSGPLKHEKFIDGQLYNALVPMFDKFSLQPLIPTIIKGTEDEDLAKRMSAEGVSYVKFKSASKVETPKELDDLYENYDENNPETRFIKTFEQRLTDGSLPFKSEHTLFMTHLKEQVRIDAEVHDDVIFGSQARKLILMNLLSLNTVHDKADFIRLYNQYKGLIDDLVQIEKTLIYNKLGIKSENGTLKLKNMDKLVRYFRDEISKKNQDSNVTKALELDEKTGKFKIPLDAAVQAQIIEGILISSINNNIVRYKSSGSMLTQVSITGSAAKKFTKESSEKALETFGNKELKYYDLKRVNGKLVTSAMQVKIGLTKQWLPLLELNHYDGNKIDSIERLNESLKNEAWVEKNRKSITMVSYRIPTQGRNFLDVMEVAEFLPSHFGDAIIMPSEMVIKNGGDFDIDKMFVFYSNMYSDGTYAEASYTGKDLKKLDAGSYKGAIQNKLYETMAEIILHPNNYMELVTPSTNFHIMPIVDKIYEKLGLKEAGVDRPKTDYKNTDIINRSRNIEKFLSLLNGKADLGIAALANTFNVLFQLSDAKANPEFFSVNGIQSFFSSEQMTKDKDNNITDMFYGDIYDEDGMLKSEFFSEFISAFVDVANDDYVFGVNVVTEFSPMLFYMKFAGLSSKKILAFINQPILRTYIKNLSKYENMFVKNYLETQASDAERQLLQYTGEERLDNPEVTKLEEKMRKLRSSAKTKALSETLKQFGFMETTADRLGIKVTLARQDYSENFTAQKLYNNIQNDKTFSPKKLNQNQKNIQLAALYEMLNMKEQSDSLTTAQRFLNFDTKPYVSAFDVYVRDVSYSDAVTAAPKSKRNNILSPDTLRKIKKESVISPLDVSIEIKTLLETLLPVRNNKAFNKIILEKVIGMREGKNKNINSEEDMLKYARTAKNDFMNYILQNYFDSSTSGNEFFKSTFETDKSFNEYLKELIETNKLRNQLTEIRNLEDYDQILKRFPILGNIVIQPGTNTKNLITYKFIENGSGIDEKQSVIAQLKDIVSLQMSDLKLIKSFGQNISLYSIFQSGYNTSDLSYTGITPVTLINTLYAAATEEFQKLTPSQKADQYDKFFKQFGANNPGFFSSRKPTQTITGEVAKKGKWYSEDVTLTLKKKPEPKPKAEKKTEANNLELNVQSYIVDYIKLGRKKTDSRTLKIRDGVYKLVNKDGNSIFAEFKLYKKLSVLDLDSQVKKEAYAKAEGFESWIDLEYNIEMGYTKVLTKDFLEGNQKVFVYTVKYLPTTASETSTPTEPPVIPVMPKKPFERTFVPPTRDAQGNVIPKDSSTETSSTDNESKINKFRELLPWTLDMTNGEIEEMYNKEKESGELIEEFLQRMSCLGKLK